MPTKKDLLTGVVVTTGLAIASGSAGGFVTNLISTDPRQIARGASLAAIVPVAFSGTCAAAAWLSDRDDKL